jgi:hypothetical protein
MALVYPLTLPGPTSLVILNDERRLIHSDAGVRQTSVQQRDRLAVQRLTFIFTFAECAVFRAWWQTDLMYGGAWFSATWPLPQGLLAGIRKFLHTPKWEYLPLVGWQVSVECEMRGYGAVLTSIPTECLTGPAWTSRTASSTKRWSSVTYGSGVFVVSGTNLSTSRPAAMYSTDKGATWTESQTAFPDTFGYGFAARKTAFGNGVFLGVLNAAQAFTSTDGINWTEISISFSTAGVHFGGGIFVLAIPGTSTCMTSSDGSSFTSRTMPASDTWGPGAYGAGRHMLSANDKPAYSDNAGFTWTYGGTFPIPGVLSMAYGAGVWLAVPTGTTTNIFRSVDGGNTWGSALLGFNANWGTVKYVGGIFYIIDSNGGNCKKSVDGLTWIAANNTSSLVGSIDFDFSIDALGFRYVAAGDNGSSTSTVNSGICG